MGSPRHRIASVIDPLERWRALGLDEKPDYAGLLTFAGLPFTQDPAELAGVDVAISAATRGSAAESDSGTNPGRAP